MVSSTRAPARGFQASDVVVAGAGVAGLCVARACALRGLRVRVLGPRFAGAASLASAGVLAPSVRRRSQGAVHRFMLAARDRYPDFLEQLHATTGVRVPGLRGVLEVARSDAELESLRATPRDATSRPLGPLDVAALEPTLRCTAGGWLHERDGAVDTGVLLATLERALDDDPRVHRDDRALVAVMADAAGATLRLSEGSTLRAPLVVIAAGAWSSRIDGLGLAVPLEPLAGEIAFAPRSALRHVVFGAGGYLVPREDALLVGASSDARGFDTTPAPGALLELRAVRDRLLEPGTPGHAPFQRRAVGLRPMTADGLPVIGAAASVPGVSYACGYGRNGVLIAPLAAECIAAVTAGDPPPFDTSLFAPDREARARAPSAVAAGPLR